MIEEVCPGCGNGSHLTTPESAQKVYDTNSWQGNTGMFEVSSADRVCAWCKAIRINGEWTRIQTVQSRKKELMAAGSNKSWSELDHSLTAGEQEL
jgi:hypothetical protein